MNPPGTTSSKARIRSRKRSLRAPLPFFPLRSHDLDRLPRYCDAKKIRCDDDVDDLTFKLFSCSATRRRPSAR
jgi:hypothetical protein